MRKKSLIILTVLLFGIYPIRAAYDAAFDPSSGYDDGWIAGEYYSNDSSFSFHLGIGAYSRINVVPEPMTILLFGLGGLLLSTKKNGTIS